MPDKMTVKLGEAARYSGQIPYDDPASLPYRSWLVWRAALTRGTAIGEPRRYNDIPGLIFQGKFATIILDLFPEIATEGDDDTKRRMQEEIRQYLRATNNAICLQWRQDPVTWWVRSEWNDSTNGHSPSDVASKYVATPGEKKLRKSEVGEDRTPAPVSVRYVTPKTMQEETHMPTTPRDQYFGIHPRWVAEIVWTMRKSRGTIVRNVVQYVSTRTSSFRPSDIATTVMGDNRTNIATMLSGLADADLITRESGRLGIGTGSIESIWSTTSKQRRAIAAVIAFAESDALVDWCERSTDDDVYAVIPSDGAVNLEHIARAAFVFRSRVYSSINNLVHKGVVTKVQEGNVTMVQRTPPGTISPYVPSVPADVLPPQDPTHAPVPISTPEPEREPEPVKYDSSVLSLAELLDQTVNERVAKETAEVRLRSKKLTLERDELRRMLTDVTEERNALRERLAQAQAILKS